MSLDLPQPLGPTSKETLLMTIGKLSLGRTGKTPRRVGGKLKGSGG